ncbi:hypothetical protein EYF80_031936 [Liparis tanakae]|uniref:Uncharacterized protein n=1 Tax=Liparis tanakae TaxID=230148 RepID=A0A4Z2GZ22_9TELE|nr:hypothetical protein EYF80_031936 [Liparis tanakae]
MSPAEHRDQLEVLEAQRPSAASEGDTATQHQRRQSAHPDRLPDPLLANSLTPPFYLSTPPFYLSTPPFYLSTPPFYLSTPPFFLSTPPFFLSTPPFFLFTPPFFLSTPPFFLSTPPLYLATAETRFGENAKNQRVLASRQRDV